MNTNVLIRVKTILLAALCVAQTPLATGAASPFADKPCKSYSSYRDEAGKEVELLWGRAPLEDFGSRTVAFDFTGVRQVHPVPAPGVHPRIYFTPDDLPDLRHRLKQTQCGQAAWNNLLCWTEMMKGRYDDKAPYAKNDVWQGGFGGLHGPVPLFRLGVPREKGFAYNHHPAAARNYRALVDGSATSFPDYYWNVFSLEAFRCLIENDEAGAKDLAKAVITAMKLDQAKRAADKKASNPPDEPVGRFQLAFVYDFIFNWLTPAQHAAIHDELANSTWHHDNYGTFNTAEGSRSNWATFSYWLFEVLGIEDEPGFNDLKVRGMFRGWRNLFTYGWFQSGATYEGEAKNQLGMDGVIPFAMREKEYGFQNLCGHPYLRAYATKFLPASVIPTLDGFIKYDLLGGAHSRPMPPDSLGLKYMFPNDKVIDWIFRCAVGEHYENVPDRCDGYRNDLLFFLCYATDFDPANNDPAKLNLPQTFFCGERALLMTRSSWDKDALMINLHTREANGGHPFADRNSIMVAGAGRVWSPPGYASFRTPENSAVVIDGKTQDEHSPGRMVDFADEPLATFAVGDAKYPWDWNLAFVDKTGGGFYTAADVHAGKVKAPKGTGWTLENHSVNDFAFTKLSFAYLNTTLAESSHWILPVGAVRPYFRQPNYPVQRAFRTAGLVRGVKPYALVVDDIQKDSAVHHYDWTLALENDIQIAKVEKHGEHGLDVILTGNDPQQKNPRGKTPLPPNVTGTIPAGQPMLLVRVLNVNSTKPVVPTIVELPNLANPKNYSPIRRLLIPADAVSPDFRVLLFAFHQGDALPQTTWNGDRTAVSVEAGGVKDRVEFIPGKSGKTSVAVVRAGKTLVQLDREVTPLN